MKILVKITALMTLVACTLVLAISIWPGWLNDLLLVAIPIGLFAAPCIVLAVGVFVFIQYQHGSCQQSGERAVRHFDAVGFAKITMSHFRKHDHIFQAFGLDAGLTFGAVFPAGFRAFIAADVNEFGWEQLDDL